MKGKGRERESERGGGGEGVVAIPMIIMIEYVTSFHCFSYLLEVVVSSDVIVSDMFVVVWTRPELGRCVLSRGFY